MNKDGVNEVQQLLSSMDELVWLLGVKWSLHPHFGLTSEGCV